MKGKHILLAAAFMAACAHRRASSGRSTIPRLLISIPTVSRQSHTRLQPATGPTPTVMETAGRLRKRP